MSNNIYRDIKKLQRKYPEFEFIRAFPLEEAFNPLSPRYEAIGVKMTFNCEAYMDYDIFSLAKKDKWGDGYVAHEIIGCLDGMKSEIDNTIKKIKDVTNVK